MNTPTIEQLAATVGAIGALYGGWRKVVLPKVVRPCVHFTGRVSMALVAVDEIRAFLGPNGGSSLGDMIHATNVRTQRLEDELQLPLFEVLDDRLIRINASFERAFGYAPDELLEKRWIRLIHHDEREHYLREWRYAQADKRLFEYDARFIAKGGTTYRVRVEIEPRSYAPSGTTVLRWFGRIVVLGVETPKGVAP